LVNKTVLHNGIRILTQKMPYVRSVSMGVWINAGARDEALSENGLSHFIEHMIFKGTARRTAFQIAGEFDAVGGNSNAFTTMETTCFHAKVMDTHLGIMADILCDIFLNSLFDEKEVENERPVILQEIGMIEDSPEDYIHLLAENTFWGDHPLGRSVLGTRENIAGFDAENIRRFFHRIYQPGRIVVSAAGNLEHEQFLDLVGPAFESLIPGNGFPERTAPQFHSQTAVYPKELEQVHICLESPGLAITDPRRYAFSLMNTILGGNMSSRLFQEIREKRGLAYSVYSFINSYEDTGIFGICTGVQTDKREMTVDLLLKELQKLKENKVEPMELSHAKEFSKGSLLLSSESSDNRMVRLAQSEIHFGKYVPLPEIIDNIEAVKEEEILDLADTLFQPDKYVLTLLGDVSS